MTYSSATHALSVNPATGETIAAYPWATQEEVEQAIARADAGFRQWRSESVARRAQKLRDLGAALRHRAEEMARMMSPRWANRSQARAEVAKSAGLCDRWRCTRPGHAECRANLWKTTTRLLNTARWGRFWR